MAQKKIKSYINAFEVIKPKHDLEEIGEMIFLSWHGEYCPEGSLRGYRLQELLEQKEHYKIAQIVQSGELVLL